MSKVMKNHLRLMMMMAMSSPYNNGFGDVQQSPTIEEIEQKKAISLKERNFKQGINEYFYGVSVIYARTKKNADKKAKRQGLI